MAREILPDDPYVVREIHCEADRHITEEIILDCLSEDLQKYVVDCGGVKYIMKGILRSEIERTVYVFSEADLMHGGKIEETIDTKNLVNIMVEPDDAGAPHDTSVKLWIGMARWFSYQFFKTSFDFDKWMEEHDGRLDGWVICQNRMEALAHLDRLRAEGRICDNLFCQMHERILLAPDDYDVDLDSQPFVFDFLTPVENKRMDRAGGLTTMIRLVASFAMARAPSSCTRPSRLKSPSAAAACAPCADSSIRNLFPLPLTPCYDPKKPFRQTCSAIRHRPHHRPKRTYSVRCCGTHGTFPTGRAALGRRRHAQSGQPTKARRHPRRAAEVPHR